MIEIDDELISNMIENTLRIGIYGKIEQKKRNNNPMSPKSGEMFLFEGSPDGKSPNKREFSMIATKDGPLTEEEIEKLRRENLELMEEIRKYQAAGMGNKTACCAMF